MRLIDADALSKTLRDISKRQKYEDLLTKKDGFPTVADVIEAICQDLDGTSIWGFDDAPTVEERQSGRWKELIDEKWEGTTIYCPYCNENALEKYRDGLCRQVKSNYCPNCGAKMEET